MREQTKNARHSIVEQMTEWYNEVKGVFFVEMYAVIDCTNEDEKEKFLYEMND